MDGRRRTGRIGEEWARRHLVRKGWEIWDTNWRTRLGELDIIARDRGQIVVVEVRSTRGTRFGLGYQSVDPRKQRQVRKLALQYLQAHRLQGQPFRIDVVSVLLSRSDRPIQIDHLEAAF
ncbi:YraN family protein [Paludifilum halophilum]|uniref:UPF0102 protein CHM34_16350 n=1 Tax=Paludifilum halophilum TaxID=1642702 RepID=A0A235B2J2_9BACL|nr:YraN family protein [Paludifilum halophilum]OYD06462.1 hypothetical protein CHM34_16350 [Paludifilum halophilum]